MTVSLIHNIATFGAAGRIDAATTELQNFQRDYEAKCVEVDSRRAHVARTLERLVHAKLIAHESLSQIREVTDSLSARERTFIAEQPAVGGVRADLNVVTTSLSAGDVVVSAMKGGAAAVTSAAGAWALVGAFGSASTGASIATLSGAAATNATLAWFGGGAVAAGGSGMAGGAMVLGGVVAIPAVVLMAAFTHVAAGKKIEELKAHGARLIEQTEICEKTLVALVGIEARAIEIADSIHATRRGFDHLRAQVAVRLRRTWYQRAWRAICVWFGGSRYSPREVAAIAELASAATAFARIIDQRVLNEDGSPT